MDQAQQKRIGRRADPRRRGGVYVAVLGASLFVALIGLTVMAEARARRRSVNALIDTARARQYADAGVQLAAQQIAADSNWRSSKSSGPWVTNQAFDGGKLSISGTDPLDGNLANRPYDKVVVQATGERGTARQIVEATLMAKGTPIEALSLAITVRGELNVNSGTTLTLQGGTTTASTNGTFYGLGATTVGKVQCFLTLLPGTVTGGVTILSLGIPMPDSGVQAMYVAIGTPISTGADIDRSVLTPTRNPWGTPNADGVYVINSSSDVRIRRSRIHGTLIVVCPGRTVTIEDNAFIQAARADYPALIVDGSLSLEINSGSGASESSAGVNFNPTGAPYLGLTDSDTSDTYACEITGLVHVKGSVVLKNNCLVRGAIISESTGAKSVEISGNATVVNDGSLSASPPMGYTKSVTMVVEPGSYKQVVLP